jgi:membrane-associated protein
MEWFTTLLHYSRQLDVGLTAFVSQYGTLAYIMIGLIIFAEIGLVVAFVFLPGESLVFFSGAVAADGMLQTNILLPLIICASVLGGQSSYWIGRLLKSKIKFSDDAKILKREYYEETARFFATHSGKAIAITRFIPVVRAFTPVVAGIIAMPWLIYTVFYTIGVIFWASIYFSVGYYMGTIPFVRNNFVLVIPCFALVTLVPATIRFLTMRRQKAQIPPLS